METIDIVENEIAKNQIAFDFDLCQSEEESVLSEKLSQKDFEWVTNDVLFVVVKNKSGAKVGWYDNYICGRPLVDWVAMAGGGCERVVVDDCENIVDVLKTIQTQKPYILTLYSDTPLMTKEVVFKIMDYFVRNRLNAMTLQRGYVVKTEFLKNMQVFSSTTLEKFDDRAFTRIKDGQSFVFANNIIRDKIFDYHEKNGVVILDRPFTVIDADVEIDSGVVIKRCNVLKGQSVIGRDTILQEGNIVVNSIIGEGCDLLGCRVYESKIGLGQKLSCQDFFETRVFGKIEN